MKATVTEKYLAACNSILEFDSVEQAEQYVLKTIDKLKCFYNALVVPKRKIETKIKPALKGTIYEVYAETYRAGRVTMVLVVLFRVESKGDPQKFELDIHGEPEFESWQPGKLYDSPNILGSKVPIYRNGIFDRFEDLDS